MYALNHADNNRNEEAETYELVIHLHSAQNIKTFSNLVNQNQHATFRSCDLETARIIAFCDIKQTMSEPDDVGISQRWSSLSSTRKTSNGGEVFWGSEDATLSWNMSRKEMKQRKANNPKIKISLFLVINAGTEFDDTSVAYTTISGAMSTNFWARQNMEYIGWITIDIRDVLVVNAEYGETSAKNSTGSWTSNVAKKTSFKVCGAALGAELNISTRLKRYEPISRKHSSEQVWDQISDPCTESQVERPFEKASNSQTAISNRELPNGFTISHTGNQDSNHRTAQPQIVEAKYSNDPNDAGISTTMTLSQSEIQLDENKSTNLPKQTLFLSTSNSACHSSTSSRQQHSENHVPGSENSISKEELGLQSECGTNFHNRQIESHFIREQKEVLESWKKKHEAMWEEKLKRNEEDLLKALEAKEKEKDRQRDIILQSAATEYHRLESTLVKALNNVESREHELISREQAMQSELVRRSKEMEHRFRMMQEEAKSLIDAEHDKTLMAERKSKIAEDRANHMRKEIENTMLQSNNKEHPLSEVLLKAQIDQTDQLRMEHSKVLDALKMQLNSTQNENQQLNAHFCHFERLLKIEREKVDILERRNNEESKLDTIIKQSLASMTDADKLDLDELKKEFAVLEKKMMEMKEERSSPSASLYQEEISNNNAYPNPRTSVPVAFVRNLSKECAANNMTTLFKTAVSKQSNTLDPALLELIKKIDG